MLPSELYDFVARISAPLLFAQEEYVEKIDHIRKWTKAISIEL